MELPLELEEAIRAAPDDREAYLVAADWLQDRGALQGEIAGEDDRERAIALLPPAMRGESPFTIEWRWGFVRGVLLAGNEPRLLGELLASPIARFVQKLVVQDASARVVEAIFAAAEDPRVLRCLRTLMVFGDRIDLTRLSTFPLRRLVVRGTATGALDLPDLLELSLDRCDASAVLARSFLPSLEMLQLGTFDPLDPDRWLEPERLPALRVLTLGVTAQIATAVWRESRIAPQLQRLDIFEMVPGLQTARVFVVDESTPGDAALLAMTGPERGTLIPLVTPHVVRARHCELHRDRSGWTARRYDARTLVFVNGYDVVACPMRSLDELAVRDRVYRFVEGDVATEAALLRTRYGLAR